VKLRWRSFGDRPASCLSLAGAFQLGGSKG
jgi:hypothetical protein